MKAVETVGRRGDRGRWAELVFAVRAALHRATYLSEESTRLRRRSEAVRAESGRVRGACHPQRSGLSPEVGFRLCGLVDGEAVSAEWSPGGLRASRALLVRADLVVRLGDSFAGLDGSRITADLNGGATQVLLTLMRACDQIDSVSIKVAEGDD